MNIPDISLICALTKNNVIGKNGAMPWHIKEDLQYFKQTTLNKVIIMGNTTFNSINKAPLPNRYNIVLTSNPLKIKKTANNLLVLSSLEEAIKEGIAISQEQQATELMIIGGSHLYEQTLPLANKLYLTRIDATIEGDRFFPSINLNDWKCTKKNPMNTNKYLLHFEEWIKT